MEETKMYLNHVDPTLVTEPCESAIVTRCGR